jgi:general stress protein YciG
MSGNSTGGKRAAETNKRLHGEDFYAKIGSKGGKATGIKGFAADPERAREAGRKAGKRSKVGYRFLYSKRGFNYYEKKATGEKVKYRAE